MEFRVVAFPSGLNFDRAALNMRDDNQEDEASSFEDDSPTETPFDPQQGIWFKYGRIYLDRANQIEQFETHCGYSLPKDFLELIGEYCSGGFDGWYQIKTGSYGSIVWARLLLMKMPDDVDRDMHKRSSNKERNYITTELLHTKRSIFYSKDGQLERFPFGTAYCFKTDNTGSDGYLVFDLRDANRVKFVSDQEPKEVLISATFTEMTLKSVFQFYG